MDALIVIRKNPIPNPIKELQEARKMIERIIYDVLPLEHRIKLNRIDEKVKVALQELLQRGMEE